MLEPFGRELAFVAHLLGKESMAIRGCRRKPVATGRRAPVRNLVTAVALQNYPYL